MDTNAPIDELPFYKSLLRPLRLVENLYRRFMFFPIPQFEPFSVNSSKPVILGQFYSNISINSSIRVIYLLFIDSCN